MIRTFALALVSVSLAGCSPFMAGWREGAVLGVEPGMHRQGVMTLAGEPQRRGYEATNRGQLEAWYYVIRDPDKFGGLQERPIVFDGDTVVGVGRGSLNAIASPPTMQVASPPAAEPQPAMAEAHEVRDPSAASAAGNDEALASAMAQLPPEAFTETLVSLGVPLRAAKIYGEAQRLRLAGRPHAEVMALGEMGDRVLAEEFRVAESEASLAKLEQAKQAGDNCKSNAGPIGALGIVWKARTGECSWGDAIGGLVVGSAQGLAGAGEVAARHAEASNRNNINCRSWSDGYGNTTTNCH